MARFNSPNAVFNDPLSIFNKEFLASSSSLIFSVSGIPGYTVPILSKTDLGFVLESRMVALNPLSGQIDLSFFVTSEAEARASAVSKSNLDFELTGEGDAASFLLSKSSLVFEVIPDIMYFRNPVSQVSLDFDMAGVSLSGRASATSEASLEFEVVGVSSGIAQGSSNTELNFEVLSAIRGATFLGASSELVFYASAIPDARADVNSFTELSFDLSDSRLNGLAGISNLINSELLFETEVKLRTSPWQGISEIGNAIYQEGEFDSNYGKSPFREEYQG